MKLLIRFDDICPEMNWSTWSSVEEVLDAENIKPIVAVVPDNKDPKLNFGKPHPRFWHKVREWQAKGWTIALHGYQHIYTTTDPGIIGLNKYSEFAGLPYPVQKEKIDKGIAILKQQKITPQTWIAPAHSFDHNTLRALREHHITRISDGYYLYPGKDKNNLFWIPQQIWTLKRTFIPFGIWTVCYHINSWQDKDLQLFKKHISRVKNKIMSLQDITDRYKKRTLSITDKLFEKAWRLKLRLEKIITK